MLILVIGVGAGIVYALGSLVVRELPYDMVFTEAPGENYIVFGIDDLLNSRFMSQYTPANLPLDVAKERSSRLQSLVTGIIEPILSENNLTDDVIIYTSSDYEPPILQVGIYDPTPAKVEFIASLLEKYRGDYYNYTFVFYRMLTPLSMEDRLKGIVTNMSIVRTLYDLAGEVFQGWSFPESPLGDPEFPEARVYYIIGAEGGISIVVRKPNPTDDEIRRWVTGVRGVIPEDIPLIFCFVDKDMPKITPLIEIEKTSQTTTQNEEPTNIEVSSETTSNQEISQWPLTILLIGIVVIAIPTWILKKQIS